MNFLYEFIILFPANWLCSFARFKVYRLTVFWCFLTQQHILSVLQILLFPFCISLQILSSHSTYRKLFGEANNSKLFLPIHANLCMTLIIVIECAPALGRYAACLSIQKLLSIFDVEKIMPPKQQHKPSARKIARLKMDLNMTPSIMISCFE